jgi:DNA-binding CsgD family transcriptional regulator
MAKSSDLLRIVEAAYELDSPEDVWLKRIGELVRPLLDDGFGLAAFAFTRMPNMPPLLSTSLHLWMPEALAEAYPRIFAGMDPELRNRPFAMGPCVTGSQMMGMRKEFAELPQMKSGLQRFGMFDSVWVTATDPTGVGCGFHAGRRVIAWPKARELQRWGRIAAHLSSALRVRNRLRSAEFTEEPSAVFNAKGHVEHAIGLARERGVREVLQHAVLTLERVRGKERLENPDSALGKWRALVAGEWSLMDRFETDGRRYIVARQNAPTVTGASALTQRERQVVGFAQLGHHNKLIAYELGIAASTVRVLMARAAAKLGASCREELLEHARKAGI